MAMLVYRRVTSPQKQKHGNQVIQFVNLSISYPGGPRSGLITNLSKRVTCFSLTRPPWNKKVNKNAGFARNLCLLPSGKLTNRHRKSTILLVFTRKHRGFPWRTVSLPEGNRVTNLGFLPVNPNEINFIHQQWPPVADRLCSGEVPWSSMPPISPKNPEGRIRSQACLEYTPKN